MSTEQVLGALIFLLTGVFGLLLKALASTFTGFKETVEKDKAATDSTIKELSTRVAEEEKATTRVEGELKLYSVKHDNAVADLLDMKKTMLTKSEFESRMNNQDKLLGLLLQKSDDRRLDSVGRYPSQQMPAVRPKPESDPPRNR